MIDALLQAAGLKKLTLIFGLIGAIAALKWVDAVGIYGRMFAVVTGCAIAQAITPVTLLFFQFNVEYEGGTAFVIGLFGMSIVGAIMKAINSANLWELVKDIVSSWFSKK